ncbi:hypothetical protein AB6A40_003055 [Gnathostoma spinigerum]|uniref:EF-hand domain-containing protein n=1 Tax=Gnathostoma spinigerum TaxID=75299 RepID=A0ABD6EG26_9BILA
MELHFLKFASAEYDDAVYMTPADFLDSLTIKAPKERVYRRVLSEDEVKRMLESTPKFGKGGRRMMRTLDRKGLISFADYIFLLTVLMKSEESFKIAFIVFDRDGNGLIEKDEFLMMRSVVSAFRSTRTHATDDRHCAIGKTSELQNLVKRFRLNLREQEKIVFDKSDEEVKMQDTTILIHLFGRNGEKRLSYNDFCMFCHNITSEVTEVEFHLYSRGTNEISPTDFARLLLRYSSLDPEDFARYIHRIHERTLSDDMGINLEQYRNFSKLLYNIDKFAAAVRLYTHANMNVTEKEFIRAVKVSTDVDIDPHVVKLIFKIFDVDENGSLSYSEFIALMMDHVNRGLKVNNLLNVLAAFLFFIICI